MPETSHNPILVMFVPVIHQGYLNLLKSVKNPKEIVVVGEGIVKKVKPKELDKACLSSKTAQQIMTNFSKAQVSLGNEAKLKEIRNQDLILVDDAVGRALFEHYFAQAKVEWRSVFLRWDRQQVVSSRQAQAEVSNQAQDIKLMKAAYKQAQHSSDWWRQVGGVVVKDGQVVLASYNKGVPSDHTPYQHGAVRDKLAVGEKPELANYIHAEQDLIAGAARQGLSLEGCDLYLTHFPCPVCAKLIAAAGIENCYFSEGSSVLDGQQVMEAAGVKLKRVEINKKYYA